MAATITIRPPTLHAVRKFPTRAPFLTPMMLIHVRSAITTSPAIFVVVGVSRTKAPR
jgi:hypothetical protein